MSEVLPDPSVFGQPVVAPVAAPADPSVLQRVEAQVEAVAHEVEALVHPVPADAVQVAPPDPTPDPPEPVSEPVEVLRRVEDGWHQLSGLSNGVTLPPSMR